MFRINKEKAPRAFARGAVAIPVIHRASGGGGSVDKVGTSSAS